MTRATDDEQLMGRIRQGDREALASLVRRHAAPLLSFVTRMVRDRAVAEDLFQEVWIAVWVKRRTFDTTRRFKPWVYRIAANRCSSWRRTVRPQMRMEPAIRPSLEHEPVGGRGVFRAEALAAADEAIRALPPTQREVVCLRLFASLGYAEIADVLQVTESTVRSNMSHALRSLRGALAEWVDESGPQETRDEHAQSRGQHPRAG